METPHLAKAVLLMFAALQTIYYYDKLPDNIASHFVGGGRPDRWTSKPALFFTYWIFLAMVLVISLGVPALVVRLPRRLINLPRKEYWLSEEMYPETIRLVRIHFHWLGVILLSLQVGVFQVIFQTNLSQDPRLSGWFIAILVGFAVALLVWIIKFTTRFRQVPEEPQSS
jgi:uncharacterized membrane protein